MGGLDASGIATWVGVGVAVLSGGAGCYAAGIANNRSAKANELAALANQVAIDALARTEESNRIAERANALAVQSADQLTEDWFVNWNGGWNNVYNILNLANKGSNSAMNLNITVSGQDFVVVWPRVDEVKLGQVVQIPLSVVADQRRRYDLMSPQVEGPINEENYRGVPEPFRCDIEISLRWRSALSVPSRQTIRMSLW